jgi:hypothetical protein
LMASGFEPTTLPTTLSRIKQNGPVRNGTYVGRQR